VFVELAKRLPRYRFVMIGGMAVGRYRKAIEKVLANASPNFHYLGPKTVDEVNEVIRESDLLMYTSLPVEGFGNSFMQAWFRRVPTVSFQFPLDGIPEQVGIGRCSMTFEDLVADVEELMENHQLRQTMGDRARDYAMQELSVDKMVSRYEALFGEMVGHSVANGQQL
jgi:glycosyltransferase involved in cell wall biosynthesis